MKRRPSLPLNGPDPNCWAVRCRESSSAARHPGTASWYGPRFNGRRTASGERFDMREFTAAHRTLPFGTLVRVHSLVNGKEVDVRITDRGPYTGSRIIDLSRAAAEELGMLGLGFKEVVLLVPESTPEVEAAPSPGKPARRPRRSTPKSRR